MALGSVSIAPFTVAELTEAFGPISTVPCTRAEITKMFKEKMNPYGKVVWSGVLTPTNMQKSIVDVPKAVDYVVVNGTKIARGGNGKASGYTSTSPSYQASTTVSFSTDGTLTASSHDKSSNGTSYIYLTLNLNCTGYQYY